MPRFDPSLPPAATRAQDKRSNVKRSLALPNEHVHLLSVDRQRDGLAQPWRFLRVEDGHEAFVAGGGVDDRLVADRLDDIDRGVDATGTARDVLGTDAER